jgi:DNA-binding CsgD family transcriptional regulator
MLEPPQATVLNLSLRERQCLTFLAKGLRLKDIARTLGTKVKTVDKQVSSACDKLGASTKEEAVVIAIRLKLMLNDV